MIGMIVSKFPVMHETFIAQEFSALRAAGVPIRIYSLKYCTDRIVHPEAESLLDITTYVAWNDPKIWASACSEFFQNLPKARRTLSWVLTRHNSSLKDLGKALIIWIQSMALSKKMADDGVSHIHSHWATFPTTAAYLCSLWLGKKFSFTAHAWDIFVENPSLSEKVGLAEKTITCTEYNRNYLATLCPESADKIILNYHGVDVSKFRSNSSGCKSERSNASSDNSDLPLFLSVGRLVESKGFGTLVDAYKLVHSDGQPFQGIIVGDGPLKAQLQRQLDVHGLSGSVKLVSAVPRDELRDLYDSAFAFIVPSVVAKNGDRDGIPNVLLEAMAMGIPVISTSTSGIPEVVEHGQTGLIVAPNDPDGLASAIRILGTSPSTARRLGERGKMRVRSSFCSSLHMKKLVAQMGQVAGNSQC